MPRINYCIIILRSIRVFLVVVGRNARFFLYEHYSFHPPSDGNILNHMWRHCARCHSLVRTIRPSKPLSNRTRYAATKLFVCLFIIYFKLYVRGSYLLNTVHKTIIIIIIIARWTAADRLLSSVFFLRYVRVSRTITEPSRRRFK